ncbi:hypothetical protein EGK63_12235 [Brevundimonas sp. 357]|nr:hypothetical protein EGK63_12235 [Brevundimonas sp. 357]
MAVMRLSSSASPYLRAASKKVQGNLRKAFRLALRQTEKEAAMPDPNDAPEPIEQTLEEEVKTNRALERGLGVGARELAAIHESGAEGTLERAVDEDGEPVEEQVEVGDAGRSASVLDRKEI